MADDMRATLRTYIMDNFLMSDDESLLEDGQSLLDTGVIDSTGVLELIQYLEETFGFAVDDEELIPENLDSVDNLVAFIGRKQQAA
jgi:acyl carrier protein